MKSPYSFPNGKGVQIIHAFLWSRCCKYHHASSTISGLFHVNSPNSTMLISFLIFSTFPKAHSTNYLEDALHLGHYGPLYRLPWLAHIINLHPSTILSRHYSAMCRLRGCARDQQKIRIFKRRIHEQVTEYVDPRVFLE